MATTYSGPGFVVKNGRVLLQSSKIAVEFDSGNKDVLTLLHGRAGHSTGPLMVTINVDSPIPQDGVEADPIADLVEAGTVTLAFKVGVKTYTCEGDIRTASLGTSVGDPNTSAFSFHGKLVSAT